VKRFWKATRLKNDCLIVDDKDCLIIAGYSLGDDDQSLRIYMKLTKKILAFISYKLYI
jgi:hypothetical protein